MKKNKWLKIMAIFALSLVLTMSSVSYCYASKGGGAKPVSYSLTSLLDPVSGDVSYNFQWQGYRINHIYVYIARNGSNGTQEQIGQFDYTKTKTSGTVSGGTNLLNTVVIPGYQNVDAYISMPSGSEYAPGYYEYHIYVDASDSKHQFVLSDYNFYNTAGGTNPDIP